MNRLLCVALLWIALSGAALAEGMKASEVAPKLTPEILERIDTIFGKKDEEED